MNNHDLREGTTTIVNEQAWANGESTERPKEPERVRVRREHGSGFEIAGREKVGERV